MSNILKGLQLNELSPATLASYKKKAGADATASDKAGDTKKADKRFSGIVKATKKEFDNDEKQLKEFAPVGGDDREPDEEEILRQLAAKWYHGDEDPKAERTLEMMGWEIGHVESGDDDAGVFVVRAGDENGNSYIAFNQSDLNLNEVYNNYHANRTGFSRGQRDDERHDLDKPTQVWGLKINGKVWSKGGVDVTFTSKQAALNARNSILKTKPDLEIGLVTKGGVAEELDENLHKWFKEKWVRFGPDGKIRGACARGDDSEGKPKCLPQAKAHALGKKGRKYAGAKKRREDPNPERRGPAKNVATKKKSNESEGNFAGDTPINLGGDIVKNLTIGDIVSYFGQKAKILAMSKTGNTSRIHIPSGMGGVTKDVLTKDLKRTSLSEEELDEACWKGYHKEGNKKMFGKTYPNCVKNTNEELDMTEGWKEEAQDLEDWSKEVNMRLYRAHESQRPALARQLSKLEQKHFGSEFTHPNLTNVVWSALRALQKGEMVHYDPQRVGQMPFGNIVGDDAKIIAQYNITRDELAGYRMLHDKGMVDNLEQFLKLRRLVRAKSWPLEYYEELEQLTPEEAWLKMANDLNWSKDSTNEAVQAKTDDNLRAYYAQRKAEKEKQHSESCPHCGGEMVSEELMNEKKDACYYKVKSRYKVWPSAYASGALVKCRKKGASNWGTGGKSNESIEEGDVVKFPKKHKSDLEDTHSCVKCGGDLQGGTYMGHKVKVCMPCKQVYLPPNTGIDNRGNKIDEQGVAEDQLDEKWTKKYKDSINCSNPKGFSQKAHCAGKQKNESAIMKGLKL